MDELLKKTRYLESDFNLAIKKLDIESLKNELRSLDSQIAEPNFWDDNKSAQETMK